MKNFAEWQGEPATFQLDEYDARAAFRSGLVGSRAQATPMNILMGRVEFLLNRKLQEAEKQQPGSTLDPSSLFSIKQELMQEIFAAVQKILFEQETGGGKVVNQMRLGRAANLARKAMGQGPQL